VRRGSEPHAQQYLSIVLGNTTEAKQTHPPRTTSETRTAPTR
jgi:hypothetical protein